MSEKILFISAVVPALLLCIKIYHKDKYDKEPLVLLIKLFFYGVISALIAIVMEIVLERILIYLNIRNSLINDVLLYFVVVGFSEEFAKYIMLKKGSYNSSAFNYTFDAIVYAVMVSMGFAAFENISYVFMYGFDTAILRALTAIPMHAVFSVFMGIYYGKARLLRNTPYEKKSLKMAVIVPMLIHGSYDFIASLATSYNFIFFIVFILVIYNITLKVINISSDNDRYIF